MLKILIIILIYQYFFVESQNIFQQKKQIRNDDYYDDSSDYQDNQIILNELFNDNNIENSFYKTNDNTCGLAKPKIGLYVANGKKTDHYLWPWNVQLIINSDLFHRNKRNQQQKIFCGGSIISDNYLLTAAHCFDELLSNEYLKLLNNNKKRLLKLTAQNTLIVFNSYHNDNPFHRNKVPIKINADEIIIHPKYVKNNEIINNDNYDHLFKERLSGILNGQKIIETGPRNDIALVRFTINKKLKPICLPPPLPNQKQKTPYDDRFINCKILGQGFMNDFDEENFLISKDLQVANVQISSNDNCKSKFESIIIREKINSNTLCIVGPIHPCLGDSGGPLVCLNKYTNLWHLVGVTSFAVSSNQYDRCGEFKSAVFAKVSNYLDWIYSNIYN